MVDDLINSLNSEFLTVAQARDYLKCSEGFLSILRKEGKIKSVKARSKVLLVKSSIDEYLKSNTEAVA